MGDLDQQIAAGRTAEIYLWEHDKVLKLFFPTIPLAWIDKETEVGRYIQNMQLPVPRVYDRITMQDRQGIVYEKIEGLSLLNELATKPWSVGKCARLLAHLHHQVHQVSAPANIETQRDWAVGGIPASDKLSSKLKGDVLQLLDTLPVERQLCHGDFHPGNIILTERGPVIIDWMTASSGDGIGDVARTSVILEAARTPQNTPLRWLLEWIRKSFRSTYLETIFKLRPVKMNLYFAWRAVMAANFMDVCLPEEVPGLIKIIEQGLELGQGGPA